MSDFSKGNPRHSAARDAICAVKISQQLTAAIDAWAEAHGTVRSDAIPRLIELGLSSPQTTDCLAPAPSNPVELEDLAKQGIAGLLDPPLPVAERERRIRRLTEGPPEFSDIRIDLPKKGE